MDSLMLLEAGLFVVSVDAAAVMVASTKKLCEPYSRPPAEPGRHVVLQLAVGSACGEQVFFENLKKTDWSSLDRRVAQRDPGHEVIERRVPVPTTWCDVFFR